MVGIYAQMGWNIVYCRYLGWNQASSFISRILWACYLTSEPQVFSSKRDNNIDRLMVV